MLSKKPGRAPGGYDVKVILEEKSARGRVDVTVDDTFVCEETNGGEIPGKIVNKDKKKKRSKNKAL